MARRKGKSGRRIKDWHSRYRGGDDVGDVTPRGKQMSRRAVKLREERFAAPAGEPLDGYPGAEGMVVGLFRGGAAVRVHDRTLLCGIAKTFRAPEGSSPLAVGDGVKVALTRPEHADGETAADKDRADGMILSRRPRASALSRPVPWSAKRRDEYQGDVPERVIAANMEVLLIVASARQPRTPRTLVDRFLIIAERGELTPVLVVNKIDLAEPDEEIVGDCGDLGVEAFAVSASTGKGLPALAGALRDKRSVLAGASGVGKTTLINALVPGADGATGAVRAKDERGRHTTSGAAVYDLPGSGMLVDTPGIRELGVTLDATELPWYFPEFETHARQCRFNNCTHTHEPDCAVQRAVEAGEIPMRRYESYLRIFDSL